MPVGKKRGGSAPANKGVNADTKVIASTFMAAMKKSANAKQKSNEDTFLNGGAPASSQESSTSAKGKVIGGRGGNDRSHSAAHCGSRVAVMRCVALPHSGSHTILKLTWVGTNLPTWERERTRDHQIGEPEQTEPALGCCLDDVLPDKLYLDGTN